MQQRVDSRQAMGRTGWFRSGSPRVAARAVSLAAVAACMAGASPDVTSTLPGIKRFQRLDLDAGALRRRFESGDHGSLPIDLNGRHYDLDLERVSQRAPGYRVHLITAHGLVDAPAVPEMEFHGVVRGKSGTRVRLAFGDEGVTGFIDDGEGDRTFVEPMGLFDKSVPMGAHAVYKQSDMIMPAGAGCGLAGPGEEPFTIKPFGASGEGGSAPLPKASAASAVEPCALVELGVAAEWSMVKGYGSAAAVQKRINDIMNMAEGLYEDPRINIHIKITEMFIESDSLKTWGPMDINSYLTNITTWARGVNGFKASYDVAGLWYYDPLVQAGTTGLANVGTVCNKVSGGHVIRDFTRTASFLMINQAHELGHNFGAQHVNNPKAILNPVILGDNTQWDDTTIAAILNHKHSRVCLSSCNLGPTAAFRVGGPSACSDTRRFADSSKGDPTSWLWSFGDGQSGQTQNPTHVYAQAGTYAAKLKVANAIGSDSIVVGNIKVKPFAAPQGTGSRSCAPGALTLTAAGSGTLRWYDQQQGGAALAEGSSFQTPSLSATKTYYVEAGDADFAIDKVGPAANTIGAGQYFVSNADRRLYFDVNRPATLLTAKVYASGAGPRTIEIRDQSDAQVATRTVTVPNGESRLALNIDLDPGHDYAIKYAGSPDSLNLFRNSAGASFPYRARDSLLVITHSDAMPSDSATQSGYYYYFYDWEVQERGCASVRTPVAAQISCTGLASEASAVPSLSSLSGRRFRLSGSTAAPMRVELSLRRLDGSEARSRAVWASGAYSIDLDLNGLPARLYLLEVRQGGVRSLERLIGF
jgi:hypothetical protein